MMPFYGRNTLLAGVPIAHQTGDAQVLIQPCGVLVLRATESGIVQPGKIDLDILNADLTNRQRHLLHHSDYLLHVCLHGGWQPSAPFAGCTIVKTWGAVPFPRTTVLTMTAPCLYFLLHIQAVMNLGSEQALMIAHTTHAGHMASFVDAKGHFLDVSLALPAELNGEWATLYHLRPACSQEFAGFGGRTGHERHAILVAYIDMHTVCKTSCRSDMLLATVQ